jgi:ferredoxin
MRPLVTRLATAARRVLALADAGVNRLYGSAWNPLYQSGTLAVVMLVVLLVTGVYLLLFYRIGAPWASVERITAQPWAGRWIRGLHRYAADLSVAAMVVHALRMFAQRRSWGRRVLPWVTGLVSVGVILVSGWTGYVLVWDSFGRLLAVEGARLLDLVPLFSEPIGRAFVGDRPIPGAFFFLNLFAHIAIPLGMGVVLWLHVSRVARPVLLPPRPLLWWTVGLVLLLAVLRPVPMVEQASAFRLTEQAPIDLFYAFWLPAASRVPALVTAGGVVLVTLVLLLVPRWTTPRPADRPLPSVVDERTCTGCTQCVQDCPWEAITMVARTVDREGHSELVGRVDPMRCVSCGICAGSCAPMGVGPPGRTGRDQIDQVRVFVAAHPDAAGGVVIVACSLGVGVGRTDLDGAPVYPVACAGSVHTSAIELLLRLGAGGVLVLACPPRDCWNREGPKWLEQRIYHDREAELYERVDRRRVRIACLSQGQRREAQAELRAFREAVAALAPARESAPEAPRECDPVQGSVA